MSYIYWVVDHLGYIVSAHDTRHEASWWKFRYHDANDYEIQPVNPLATLFETPRRNRNGVYPKDA